MRLICVEVKQHEDCCGEVCNDGNDEEDKAIVKDEVEQLAEAVGRALEISRQETAYAEPAGSKKETETANLATTQPEALKDTGKPEEIENTSETKVSIQSHLFCVYEC